MDNTFNLLLINGPNLNLLGIREPEKYGATTLESIEQALVKRAKDSGNALTCFQSNAEHRIIERIHAAKGEGVDFILINPAAFTHSSIAIRDALLGVNIPFIEIHLSNIHAREAFRQHSFFSDIAEGVLCGFGAFGYQMAFDAALEWLKSKTT